MPSSEASGGGIAAAMGDGAQRRGWIVGRVGNRSCELRQDAVGIVHPAQKGVGEKGRHRAGQGLAA